MMKGKAITKRKKPKFYAKEWHKIIRKGSQQKSKRKWSGAKGRHNKIRLGRKGHSLRPKIGWSSARVQVANVRGIPYTLVHNLSELQMLDKGVAVMLSSSLGAKKRKIIIEEAKKMQITLLNVKGGKA